MTIYLFRGRKTQLTYSATEGHRVTRLCDDRKAWAPPKVAEDVIQISDTLTSYDRRMSAIDRYLGQYVT